MNYFAGVECIVPVRWELVEEQTICKKYLWEIKYFACGGDVCNDIECIVPVRWELVEELQASEWQRKAKKVNEPWILAKFPNIHPHNEPCAHRFNSKYHSGIQEAEKPILLFTVHTLLWLWHDFFNIHRISRDPPPQQKRCYKKASKILRWVKFCQKRSLPSVQASFN